MIYYSYAECEDNYNSQHLAGITLRRQLFSALGIKDNVITDSNGRPYLVSDGDFSISHSKNLAVCAVLCSKEIDVSDAIHTIELDGCKIGIDAEYIDPNANEERIAKIASRYLGILPSCKDEFYTLWTRREAFGKLCGEGVFYTASDESCRYHTFTVNIKAMQYRITICIER